MYNNGNSSKNVTGASVVDGTLENADFADNGLSGDKIDGGIISNFQSTGIDDRGSTGKVLTLSDTSVDITGSASITNGSAGAYTAQSVSDNLIVEGSTSTGISIASPDANNTTLDFGSPSDSDYARLQGYYNSGDPLLRVRMNNSEVAEFSSTGIDVTGNVTCDSFNSTGNVTCGEVNSAAIDVTGNVVINNGYGFKVGGDDAGSSVIGEIANTSGVFTIRSLDTRNMRFDTADVERMRIDTNGKLLWNGGYSYTGATRGVTFNGTSTAPDIRSSASATTTLNHYVFYNGNGEVGRIYTSGSATAYITSSDYRLKENVVPMTGSIDRLKALKPSKFNFISDATTTVDGFLAHEAQVVVPEAVDGTKDAMKDEEYEVTPAVEAVLDAEGKVTTEAVEAVMGTRSVPDYQGIDQSKLVPLLVSALQEAIARIEVLENV